MCELNLGKTEFLGGKDDELVELFWCFGIKRFSLGSNGDQLDVSLVGKKLMLDNWIPTASINSHKCTYI